MFGQLQNLVIYTKDCCTFICKAIIFVIEMDIVCKDTLTGENLSSFLVANMDLIYCLIVHTVGGDGIRQ